MKISEKWLRTWASPNASTDKLLEKLTFAGFELESVEGDTVELNITPNRGDCLSILGIAREVAAIFDEKMSEPEIKDIDAKNSDKFKIDLVESEHCPVYFGRIIKNIRTDIETPQWMQERLEACHINLVSPIVDVTNYVMLELGQPMHAFDLDTLDSEINVRLSKNNEEITLLDGQKVELNDDTLLIADKSKPLAIAGIMGGEGSGVSNSTKNILLESAFFNPIQIRKAVQKYKIHTDSSYRFERGVDYTLQKKAIERATKLILEIAGGEPSEVFSATDKFNLPEEKAIKLRQARIKKVLGVKIDGEKVEAILTKLNFKVVKQDDKGWLITPPTFRPDVEIEEDLIEELARIIGYDDLPTELPSSLLNFNRTPEVNTNEKELKSMLVASGFNETITYSFIDKKLAAMFCYPSEIIFLKNPIASDMAVMRPSLLPGLISALKYNQNRQESDVKLFEVGLKFNKRNKDIYQEKILAGIWAGNSHQEHWKEKSAPCDFYDLKGVVESILYKTGAKEDIKFEPLEAPYLHSGQTAAIYKLEQKIGIIGALHPNIAAKLDIEGPVYLFEVDFNKLVKGKIPKYKPLSKYPAVRRDLAALVDKSLNVEELLTEVKQTVKEELKDLIVFDVYSGKGIPEGKKSVAIGIVLQREDKTLVESEVNNIVELVVKNLKQKFDITLRE